jgi:hypothetical protein
LTLSKIGEALHSFDTFPLIQHDGNGMEKNVSGLKEMECEEKEISPTHYG